VPDAEYMLCLIALFRDTGRIVIIFVVRDVVVRVCVTGFWTDEGLQQFAAAPIQTTQLQEL